MLSQCPHCHAIFTVSEPDIRAHHGLVRCGHCKTIFHAVINEVADTQPPSSEAAETNTLEIPFDDTASPAPPAAESGERPASETDRETRPGDDGCREETRRADELTGGNEEADWSEPALSGAREAEDPEVGNPEIPGEIVEEITIEAPPTLVDGFEAELRAAERTAAQPVGEAGGEETDRAATGNREPVHGGADAPKRRRPTAAAEETLAARTQLKSPYRTKDVRMVELPQPQPFKTASLSLLSVFLMLLLVWQVKTFYLDELAQVPLLRPYLETLCRPLGCVLPPRRDFARIELAGTSISINPEVPGALAIKADLLNNAHFPQPYPPLRVTLTDREGKVVGRRTYLPGEYRSSPNSGLLPTGEVREVTINLAQPDRDVVGYEVELVTPRSAGGV